MWKDSVDKKKKSGHPPMEDSSKLEDFSKFENFDCLENYERMFDCDRIMDSLTEITSDLKLCVKLGDEDEILLPLNNYDIKIKVEDLGYEKSVRIRAENLATGETKTYINVRPVPNYKMNSSIPFRQNFRKDFTKNEMQGNSRERYFQDYGHKNKSYTIHVSSYKEPELISNGWISKLGDFCSSKSTIMDGFSSYIQPFGINFWSKDGHGNNNSTSRDYGVERICIDGLFDAFKQAMAVASSGSDLKAGASSICDLINDIIKKFKKDELDKASTPNVRMNKQTEDKTDNSGKVLDVVKKNKGRWYHGLDSAHIKYFKTDTVVKWGRTGYYRSWVHKNIALDDTINYKDFEIIDKVKH